jgi:hypothetical protein
MGRSPELYGEYLHMEEKKSPGKPVETSATPQQLLDHYNKQCPEYNAQVRKKFQGDDEKIAGLLFEPIASLEEAPTRDQLIERIRRQNLRLGRTIRERSHELLLEKVCDEVGELILKDGYTMGLTYQRILEILGYEFPEASTSVACLRWYNVHMKGDAVDEGLPFPDLPQYRPRSSAKKKAA